MTVNDVLGAIRVHRERRAAMPELIGLSPDDYAQLSACYWPGLELLARGHTLDKICGVPVIPVPDVAEGEIDILLPKQP